MNFQFFFQLERNTLKTTKKSLIQIFTLQEIRFLMRIRNKIIKKNTFSIIKFFFHLPIVLIEQ